MSSNVNKQVTELNFAKVKYDCVIREFDREGNFYWDLFCSNSINHTPEYYLKVTEEKAKELKCSSVEFSYKATIEALFKKNKKDASFSFFFVNETAKAMSTEKILTLKKPTTPNDILIIKITVKNHLFGDQVFWLPLAPKKNQFPKPQPLSPDDGIIEDLNSPKQDASFGSPKSFELPHSDVRSPDSVVRPNQSSSSPTTHTSPTLAINTSPHYDDLTILKSPKRDSTPTHPNDVLESRVASLEADILTLKSYITSLREITREQSELIHSQASIIQQLRYDVSDLQPLLIETQRRARDRKASSNFSKRLEKEASKRSIGAVIYQSPSPKRSTPRSPSTPQRGSSIKRPSSRSSTPTRRSTPRSSSNRSRLYASPRTSRPTGTPAPGDAKFSNVLVSIKPHLPQLFDDTTVLSHLDQYQLSYWMGQPKMRWKLLYRGSRDGFAASAFHKSCDNKGPTFTIIQTPNNCVFGGYLSCSWDSRGRYMVANRCFLFSLRSHQQDSMPLKIPCVDNKVAAIGHKKKGPTFGNGCDLFIADDCNATENSYANLGVSYQTWHIHQNVDSKSAVRCFFCGTHRFRVQEIEVFAMDEDSDD
mmetsp:Transcript_6652/g.9667  ORF Transcript_6652/g.9667 Transcript_6652/m.9667 type:complete len:591 (+) Transcript_6652:40-1812(+)